MALGKAAIKEDGMRYDPSRRCRFPHTGSVGAEGEEQIDLLTVFDMLLHVVSPATALGNRARGLERELKASGRHRKHSSKK
jgi:hypothetical protein